MKIVQKFNLIIFLFSVLVAPQNVFAFDVEKILNSPVKSDFVVSPARTEVTMKAGEKTRKYITVLNRFGADYNFAVSVEDFLPSESSGEPVLQDDTTSVPSQQAGSDYSLERYIKPDVKNFFLRHGSQARIGVDIEVPRGVSSAGKYAAVLISASPKTKADSSTVVVSRIGALFLVRLEGDVKEDGELSNFLFKNGQFWISYGNNGDVHLNPYGVIEIKNEAGATLEKIQIDPWIVLPHSTRSRALLLQGSLSAGLYKATVALNRGYKDIIDEKEIDFRVGPVPITDVKESAGVDASLAYYAAGLIILIVLVFVMIKKWVKRS